MPTVTGTGNQFYDSGRSGVGQALGGGFNNASSGSLSNSNSSNKIDWNAKAKTDAQLQQGLDYAKLLRGQTSSAADNRISSLGSSYDQLQGKVDELGSYDRNRINRDAQSQSNSVWADLAGRGLNGSTIRPTLQQGVERNRLEAQGQLSESLRNQSISSLLSRIQSVDAARADQITRDSEMGQVIAELYARMGGNQPMTSNQVSTSTSASS